MGIRKTPLEKEWAALEKKEARFLAGRTEKTDSRLNHLLAEKVPDGLQSTLDAAFCKAFHLIFEKGTGVIEKTYHRDQLQQTYQVNRFVHQLSPSKKTLRTFSKGARSTGAKGVLLSGASGVGMGLLGIGLPDIPLFTAMALRTVYKIALEYGFDYDSQEEQYFILLLIQGAVSHGEEFLEIDGLVNDYIRSPALPPDYDKQVQIQRAAGGLSKELLYMKFLQGIPLVGAVGGVFDLVYMKQISGYANLKYQRRFLASQQEPQEKSTGF